jgi:hypothetical protein
LEFQRSLVIEIDMASWRLSRGRPRQVDIIAGMDYFCHYSRICSPMMAAAAAI